MNPAPGDPRFENQPQNVHLHMHQFCPCINMMCHYGPLPCRPPMVPCSPFRPFNLNQFQYNQFNMVPFNGIPFPPPCTIPCAAPCGPPFVPPHGVVVPPGPPMPAEFGGVMLGTTGIPAMNNVVAGVPEGMGALMNLERNAGQVISHIPSTSAVGGNSSGAINMDVRPIGPPVSLEDGAAAAAAAVDNNPFDIHNAISEDLASSLAGAAAPKDFSSFMNATMQFIKFIEETCLKAEQIANMNRHRPCFRNIQHLCVRTRNEILMPSTIVPNIYSQGIPWATKDFIYAFVRLINCWHILKGYIEKDGSLGKVENELTPEFKSCYYKWEKDTMELAEEIRRIFCNLDANIRNSGSGGFDSPSTSVSGATGYQHSYASVAGPVTKKPAAMSARNSFGMASVAGSDSMMYCDSSESSFREEDSIYLKPGCYTVPTKSESPNGSTRSFEFLDTAMNTHKVINKQERDKIWKNAQVAATGFIQQMMSTGRNQEGQNLSSPSTSGNPPGNDSKRNKTKSVSLMKHSKPSV